MDPFSEPFTLVGESEGRDTPQAPVAGARFSWAEVIEVKGGKSVDWNGVGADVCC